MGGNFTRSKTWVSGEILTASDLNGVETNIINNFTPAGMDGCSADVTAMRAVTDPYPAGTESLATSAEGEFQRLRYLIQQATGKTYWCQDPDNSLLSTSKPSYAGLTATGAIDEAYATVASHATTAPIWAAAANLINYTGTAVATAFPNAPQAGARRTLICADACGFTAGANMLINSIASGATYTATAGDRVDVHAISTTQFKLTILAGIAAARQSTIDGGSTLYPEFACRAWVNFDGTRNEADTGASVIGQNVKIRASGNVSSVVKNGVGDYTVNFTTAMPDVNYCPLFGAWGNSGTTSWTLWEHSATARTVSALRIGATYTQSSQTLPSDYTQVNVSIFR